MTMPLTKDGLQVGTTLLIGANLRGIPDLSDPTKAKLFRDSWLALFDDCSDGEFVAACRAYAVKPSSDKDRSWLFPCVAQIRELVPRLEHERQTAAYVRDESEDAWAFVLRMVSEVGSYEGDKVGFDFATREALRTFGGFANLCRTLPSDPRSISFAKRDFQAAYKAAQIRCAPLIEAEIRAIGDEVQRALAGDTDTEGEDTP
jgi:hypothetical protein